MAIDNTARLNQPVSDDFFIEDDEAQSKGPGLGLLKGLAGGFAGLGVTGGLSLGAGLLGSLFTTFSEKKRREELAEQMRKDLQPLIDRSETLKAGLTTSEGGLIRGMQEGTVQSLAERGVLDSSVAPAEVAAAAGPVLLRAAERRDALAERIAAAQTQISEVESAPGFGEAFGGSLTNLGGYLALIRGAQLGNFQGKQNQKTQDEGRRLDVEQAGEGFFA